MLSSDIPHFTCFCCRLFVRFELLTTSQTMKEKTKTPRLKESMSFLQGREVCSRGATLFDRKIPVLFLDAVTGINR